MATILVVDDDPNIREVVVFSLSSAGHEVAEAADGAGALALLGARRFELAVLDVMLPGIDGLEICRRIRAEGPHTAMPVLFLSARDDEIDRIIGLEVGGDDYLSKPFSPRELSARVKAMLRRVSLIREADRKAEARPSAIRHGDLFVDRERFVVTWLGREIALTVTEFGIVEALGSHPGKVYSRAELVDLAYAFDNHVTERTIDTHVKRIRKKFDAGAEPIETVFGVGYRLGACRGGSA